MSTNTGLSYEAYEIIKNKILSFEIIPGAIISDYILSQEIEMSRTPIREALVKLEQDGLVGHLKNSKKLIVSELSIIDIKEIYELRMAIECKAADIIYQNGGLIKKDIIRIKKISKDFEKCVLNNNIIDNFEKDDALHLIFLEIAGNKRLVEAFNRIKMQTKRVRFLTIYSPLYYQNTILEHNKIIDYYISSNIEKIKLSITEHLENSIENYKNILNGVSLNILLSNMSLIQKNNKLNNKKVEEINK